MDYTVQVCEVCDTFTFGGHGLLTCDTCGKYFHMACLVPPLAMAPKNGFIGPCCSREKPPTSWDWQVGMGAYGKTMKNRKSTRYYMCHIIRIDRSRAGGKIYRIHYVNTSPAKDEWLSKDHLMTHAEKANIDKAAAALKAEKEAKRKAAKMKEHAERLRLQAEREAARLKKKVYTSKATCSHI